MGQDGIEIRQGVVRNTVGTVSKLVLPALFRRPYSGGKGTESGAIQKALGPLTEWVAPVVTTNSQKALGPLTEWVAPVVTTNSQKALGPLTEWVAPVVTTN
ncbi:MAG: hypothetical protein V5A18_04905, partial [Haloarculaceae archaeon]